MIMKGMSGFYRMCFGQQAAGELSLNRIAENNGIPVAVLKYIHWQMKNQQHID